MINVILYFLLIIVFNNNNVEQFIKAFKSSFSPVHQIDINIFKHKFRKYLLKQQEIGDETAWSNANNQR